MAKLSRPVGIAGALDHLNYALHELHHLASSPSLSVMAAGTGLGESTVYRLWARAVPSPHQSRRTRRALCPMWMENSGLCPRPAAAASGPGMF